jgi:hypothetical protein
VKSRIVLLILTIITASGCNYRFFDDVVLPEIEIAPDGSLVTKVEPTFTSIQQNILIPKCISCHSPGGSADLVPMETYEDLINSEFFASVIPGDSLNSPLYKVIQPDARRRMPPRSSGLAPVTFEEADAIRLWIDSGASR